jgi:transcriptional regulator with XRE-family HTH domain
MRPSKYPNLQAEIKAKGLTYKAAAEQIGMPYSTLWQYMSGKREPSVRAAWRIKMALFPTLRIDYLFSLED